MNKNIKFCTQKGHEQANVSHQCIFEDCKLMRRQCSFQSINEGFPNYEKSDCEHIIIEQQIQKLPQLDIQDDQNRNIKQIDFQKRKYNLKQIGDTKQEFSISQISNNEKYFVYVSSQSILENPNHSMLKIYDIKEDKIIKEIKFEGRIQCCSFTFDSQQLYVGYILNIGLFDNFNDLQDFAVVYGYDVQKNFKKTYQQIIQMKEIIDIMTIQNQYLIICGYYGDIIKTDIKRKKQLFKLLSYDTFSEAYDYNQSYDFIINGSVPIQSIQLWDCGKRKIIINKERAHPNAINSLQFINNTQNLLSLDYEFNLYKWKIDLIKNDLIKLQEYSDPDGIYSFQQINQTQNLLIICGNYIKIFDHKGETINQIDHQCDQKKSNQFRNKQLDNGRYIIIANNGILLLYKEKIMLVSALN